MRPLHPAVSSALRRSRATALLLVLACASAPLGARNWDLAVAGKDRVEDEFVVRVRPGTSLADLQALAAQERCTVLRRLGATDAYHLKSLVRRSPTSIVDWFQSHGDKVAGAVPNLIRYARYAPYPFPNDPYYQQNTSAADDANPGNAWNVAIVKLDQAWNTTAGGMNLWSPGIASVVVADLDTGMNVAHQDFAGQTVAGYNTFNGTSSVPDTYGHGTFVASVISVGTNNGIGICGGAYGCRIMPVKVSTDTQGSFPLSEELTGLSWALAHGATVVNLSFGSTFEDPVVEEPTLDNAMAAGVLITASSGNSSQSPPLYPANYAGVAAIGASSDLDVWEYYSNYGGNLFCVAPDGVVGCSNTNNTAYLPDNQGTSFSAPAVAALGAILQSSGVPSYECLTRIALTCDKIDAGAYPYAVQGALGAWSDHYGYGRIDVYRALCTLVAPALVSVQGSTAGVVVAWTAPPLTDAGDSGGSHAASPAQPVASYTVYRATSAAGPFVPVLAAVTATSAVDLAAPASQLAYYEVRAVNVNGLDTRPSSVQSVFVGTPTPSPTASPTFTVSPTATASPTASASPTVSPTFSVTPTYSASPTPSPTPAFAPSHLGATVLAPVPVHQGQPLCAYFDRTPSGSAWRIYNLDGQRVAELSFGSEYQQCWDTGATAPGVYFARITVTYRDGSSNTMVQKISVVR